MKRYRRDYKAELYDLHEAAVCDVMQSARERTDPRYVETINQIQKECRFKNEKTAANVVEAVFVVWTVRFVDMISTR